MVFLVCIVCTVHIVIEEQTSKVWKYYEQFNKVNVHDKLVMRHHYIIKKQVNFRNCKQIVLFLISKYRAIISWLCYFTRVRLNNVMWLYLCLCVMHVLPVAPKHGGRVQL